MRYPFTVLLGGAVALVSAQSTSRAQGSTQVHDQALESTRAQSQRGPTATRERRVTLRFDAAPLDQVLKVITQQSGIDITYFKDIVAGKTVTVHIDTMAVYDALKLVLTGTGLSANVLPSGNVSVVALNAGKQQQTTGVVTGSVSDSATKKPIAGVTVELSQLNKRVVTSEKGTFVISGVPFGTHVVHVRYLGYQSTSRSITVEAGKQATLNFILSASASVLSGVVTTATGVQRKVEVGNDITTINVEEIIQTNPVSSVTDLLATRVPGLIVGRASGQPGAKTEVRVRGTNSIRGSNEPIYILDGVQIIGDRADADATGFATSPIDQLDVNAISKIEVLKGPSAVALYGSNAANGVIIITTKRGQDGPARWNTSVRVSQETMPGKWPINYFAWGRDLTGGKGTVHCRRFQHTSSTSNRGSNWGVFPTCQYDSTTSYQILNDPATTVFGTGTSKTLATTVTGGVRQFTYSVTGGFSSTLGYLKVPDADVALLKQSGISLASWQRRPDNLDTYNGTAAITLGINEHSSIHYTTMFTRQEKRSTPLIHILSNARFLDPPTPLYDQDGVRIGVGSGVLAKAPTFMAGQNFAEMRFTNSAKYQTTLWNTITFETRAGIDATSGRETYLLKTGDYCPLTGPIEVAFGSCVAAGFFSQHDFKSYRSSGITTDFHVLVSGTRRGFTWLNVTPVIGLDINSVMNGQSGVGAKGLPIGGLGIQGAEKVEALADIQGARRTVGMFALATLNIADRMYLPFSVRTDAGNAIGGDSKPVFPGLALSYLVSDEPKFRAVPILGALPELRLRTAFGLAGQQPRLTDKVRTFTFSRFPIDNVNAILANMYSVGNTNLSPEISRELELGFDATFVDRPRSRVSGIFTVVQKRTTNLLAVETLPPSLGSSTATFGIIPGGTESRISNIGDGINNTIEVTLEGFQRMGLVDWTTTNMFATQQGKLVRMNGNLSDLTGGTVASRIDPQIRNRVGYPLNGVWLFPVLGYVDADGNGLIDLGEVAYGDSLQYAGPSSPRFTLTSSHVVTLAARITMAATLQYEDGGIPRTENNRANEHSRVMNDPSLSFEEQVRFLYDASSRAYRISTLQLQSLQITYDIPVKFATRYVRTRSVQVALAGTNLGLWSTFSGKDPKVGGILRDQTSPILPMARTYSISVRVQ